MEDESEGEPEYAKIDPKTGQMEPPTDRPTGVTILAVLYFINAGIVVAQILITIFVGIVNFKWGAVCCALPFFLVALFYFMIGAGLFMMIRWAWFWALLLAVFGLLFGLGNLGSAFVYADWYDEIPAYYYALPVLQIVFNGLIIWYLFKMKPFFRDVDPQHMQQMQMKMMEKQLEQMKKQQQTQQEAAKEAPAAEEPPKEEPGTGGEDGAVGADDEEHRLGSDGDSGGDD